MAKLLEFSTGNASVLIAVRTPGDPVQAVGVFEDTVEKIKGSLRDAFATVSGVAESFREAVAKTDCESAEQELGFDFTAKGSLYLVAAEARSALHVKLTFKPRS